MEDPAQTKEQIESETINSRLEPQKAGFKRPSKIRVAKVILKLPIVINLRQDRRKWVKHEGKNIDEWKFKNMQKRHLKSLLS